VSSSRVQVLGLVLAAVLGGACQSAPQASPTSTTNIATSSVSPRPSSTLAPSPSTAHGSAAAALGGHILFLRKDDADNATYYSVRPDGSDLHEIAASDPMLMHISPDGKLAAELYFEDGHYGKIIEPDGTLVRTIDPPDADSA